jgi:phosphoribosyl 1,2-cyclic phosphate phosphodiesterase
MSKHSVTILGCGSSGGVPRVGSGWGVCDPTNIKNRRRRCSVLIKKAGEAGTTSALVDTSPDMREQLLDAKVESLDGIVFTHDHADHTHGIDDIRPLVLHNRRRIDAFIDEPTATGMVKRFDYVFRTPEGSQYPPILTERRIESGSAFEITGHGGALEIMPFQLVHGDINALGLQFFGSLGLMAYTPDVSAIPEAHIEYLKDLDLWIIDALRIKPHPSHFSLDEALSWIERMKPRRAVLTNLHSDLDYVTLRQTVPKGVVPAYDGMILDF